MSFHGFCFSIIRIPLFYRGRGIEIFWVNLWVLSILSNTEMGCIWSPESTKDEKSPTWVKSSVRKKSNIEVLMTIHGFMGSYWLVLMGSCEKLRTFSLFLAWSRQKFNDGRPCLGFLGRANEGGSKWKENICPMGKIWQKRQNKRQNRQNFPINIFNEIIDYSFLPEILTFFAF